MNFFEAGQLKIFLCFFWLGIVFMLISCLVCFFIEKTSEARFFLRPISQVFLVGMFFLAGFILCLKLNYGVFRGYMLFGFLLGSYICFISMARTIAKFLNFVYNKVINKFKKRGENRERKQN